MCRKHSSVSHLVVKPNSGLLWRRLVSSLIFRVFGFISLGLDCRIRSMICETPTTFLMDKICEYVCMFNQFIVFFCVCYFIWLCIHRALHRMAHTAHTVCECVSNTRTLFFLVFGSVWFSLVCSNIHTITLSNVRSLHHVCMRGWVAFNRNELTYIPAHTHSPHRARSVDDSATVSLLKSMKHGTQTHRSNIWLCVYISSGCYYYCCRRCRRCRCRGCRSLLCDVMYTTERCPYLINNKKKLNSALRRLYDFN